MSSSRFRAKKCGIVPKTPKKPTTLLKRVAHQLQASLGHKPGGQRVRPSALPLVHSGTQGHVVWLAEHQVPDGVCKTVVDLEHERRDQIALSVEDGDFVEAYFG